MHLILSLALAAAATAPSQPAETRMVAFELRQGERLLGQPRLQVRIGEPAEISTAGPDGYRLSLVVHSGAAETSYLVRSSIYRPGASGWQLLGEPAILVTPRQQARATVGHGSDSGYSLSVTVE